MLGFLSAILAGAAMSVQGVMNTRLGEKVGTLETNAFVQLIGFLLALLIAVFFGKGNIRLLPASAVVRVAGRCTRAGHHADSNVGDWQPDTDGRDFRDSALTIDRRRAD